MENEMFLLLLALINNLKFSTDKNISLALAETN